MKVITSDRSQYKHIAQMLEGYECPAMLVSLSYQVLATNQHYIHEFGKISEQPLPYCYEVSHGYTKPCDKLGEECPLSSVLASGHKEKVIHVHQTPRGQEHIDVEMLPIFDENGQAQYFIELLKSVTSITTTTENRLIGSSRPFNSLLEKITRVSNSDASVLLLGESGTGKELIAQTIHRTSKRCNQALVTLECAGLTDSLFESELFGHIKGAFTGANNNRTGLVELANGGTLFLDEIGDVPHNMQVKLLRLIETGTYRPVGSSTVKYTNFRLICATHMNLKSMVEKGSFRQDLFYRINVFPITLPTLRERKDDLAALSTHLLERITNSKKYQITESGLKRLKQYSFPGNIRELRNILNRSILLTDTNTIDEDTIEESINIDFIDPFNDPDKNTAIKSLTLLDLKAVEKKHLDDLMIFFDNDKEEVARVAGISLRSLYRKLECH